MSDERDTATCEAAPLCTVCGMRKRPRGRSVALEMENGVCGHDCPGYSQEPRAGHLWPGERARTRSSGDVRMALPKTYKRTRTIYVIGDVAFVANPATRSSWWKTHASVAVAPCPTCKALIGQLCVPSFGFCRGSTHSARRSFLPRGEAIDSKEEPPQVAKILALLLRPTLRRRKR